MLAARRLRVHPARASEENAERGSLRRSLGRAEKRSEPDSRVVQAAIARAVSEGRRARLRVQVPTVLVGLSAMGIGVGLFLAVSEQSPFLAMTAFFLFCGAVCLLLSVLPTNRLLVHVAAGLEATAGMLVAVAPVLRGLSALPLLRTCTSRSVPCLSTYVMLAGLAWVSLIGLAMFAAVLFQVRVRDSPRALLEALWHILANVCLVFALNMACSLAANLAVSPSFNLLYATFAVNAAAALAIGLVIRRPAFRVRVQSALMARGEAVLAAASLAAFIDRRASPADIVARAQATFRSVALPCIREEHFASNAPDPRIFELSTAAPLGDVDAFVSHSWSDNPQAKYAALRAWGAVFRKNQGREPLFYIDKFCISQDQIEESVNLLPCYLAGCSTLLVLMGPTLLSRLWCVVEVATFIAMGYHSSQIEVVFLEPGIQYEDFDAGQAQCFDPRVRQRLLCAVESHPGGVRAFNAHVIQTLSTAKAIHLADLDDNESEVSVRRSSPSRSLRDRAFGKSPKRDRDAVTDVVTEGRNTVSSTMSPSRDPVYEGDDVDEPATS